MKAWEYRAVVYYGNIYCYPECIDPARCKLVDESAIEPIFASSEWDSYPVCDVCGREHDYVGLTDYGRERAPAPTN